MGEIILRPTPPAPLHFTGERLTTDYGGQTEIEHLHRYLLAREWCRGKHVLDVASGEGYGTALLAQVAASAVGVEIARDAVDHAANAYQSENLRYVAGDARAIPAEDQAFDVVVSFETIEHFAEQGQFLAEVRRVLRPGGLFIVSTPDRDNYSPAETPANPYHVQELTEAEFDTLLRDRFAHVAIVAQRPMFGSVMLPPGAGGAAPICFERRGDQHFEGSAGLARPQYLIAFASDVAAPALPPSIYIDTGRLGMVSPPVAEARLNALHAALEHERRQAAATLEETCTRRDADTAAQTQHLGGQIARLESALQDSQAQIEASLAAIRLRGDELHATQLDLAAARGEAKGLVAASEMAERAVVTMRAELATVSLSASGAHAALSQANQALASTQQAEAHTRAALNDAEGRVRALTTELQAARDRAFLAEARANGVTASASWRLTAPVRAISRLLLRRP